MSNAIENIIDDFKQKHLLEIMIVISDMIKMGVLSAEINVNGTTKFRMKKTNELMLQFEEKERNKMIFYNKDVIKTTLIYDKNGNFEKEIEN